MNHDLSQMIDRDFCMRTMLRISALIHGRGHQCYACLAARSLVPAEERRPRVKRLPVELCLPAAVVLVVPPAAAEVPDAL